MNSTRASYSLRHFTSPEVAGFSDALKLYTKSFRPSVKTSTNEIAYWLDNYGEFKDDRFMVFGFYANKKLVGYAQLAYFAAECLAVVDYLVVDEEHRRDNVFFELVEHLRLTLSSADLQADYIVAEVALDGDGDDSSGKALQLLRLLRFIGFGVARAPYYQPRLGATNFESTTAAAMAIYVSGDAPVKRLRRETFLQIVHTIYYKHYERWYSIYPDQKAEYRRHLDSLYVQIKRSLAKQEYVTINGHPVSTNAKTVVETEGSKALTFTVQALTIILILTAVLFGTTTAFNVPMGAVVPVYLLALVSVFALFSLRLKEARVVFHDLVKILLSWNKTK